MGADAVVIRHGASGAPHRLATWLDRAAASSTPATAPTSTPPRRCSTPSPCAAGWLGSACDGRRITIVGDVLHSRVARSNVLLLSTLGAEVTLVAPPTLFPVGVDTWPCEVSYDLDAVLPKSDVVMMLRVQRERMNAAFFPTEREYSRRYGLDGDRMATDARARHRDAPRPDEPRNGDRRRGGRLAALAPIVEQVANGVTIRMAVLYLLLGGAEPARPPNRPHRGEQLR